MKKKTQKSTSPAYFALLEVNTKIKNVFVKVGKNRWKKRGKNNFR